MRAFLIWMLQYLGCVALALIVMMLVLTVVAIATKTLALTIPAMAFGVVALLTIRGGRA